MGWEVIEDNLPAGNSLDNLPEGYRVDRYFLNAFFKAFRERVEFAGYSDKTQADFDDILFDAQDDPPTDPNQFTAIGYQELQRRLFAFNDIVIDMLALTIFGSSGIIPWFTVDYLTTVSGDTKVFGFDNQDELFGGNSINRFWKIEDIKTLLGEEEYDSILDEKDSRKFKKASYWSSLYLLLSNVFLSAPFRQVNPGQDVSVNLLTTESTISINETTQRVQGIRYSEEGDRAITLNTTPDIFINDYITEAYSNATTGISDRQTDSLLSQSRFITNDKYHTQGTFDSEDYAQGDYSARMFENIGEWTANTTSEVEVYFVVSHQSASRRVGNSVKTGIFGGTTTLDSLETRTVLNNNRTLTRKKPPTTTTYSPSQEAYNFSRWLSTTEQIGTFIPATDDDPAKTIIDLSFNAPLDSFLGEGSFAEGQPSPPLGGGFGANEDAQTFMVSESRIHDPLFIIKQSELEFPA